MPNLFTTACISTVLLANSATAALVIEFEEVGGNVVATTSGSITLPGSISLAAPFVSFVGADPTSFYNVPTGANFYTGGVGILIGPTTSFSSVSGDEWGFSDTDFFTNLGTPAGSVLTPSTTFTWNANTLAGIGLGGLTTTPSLMHTLSNGQTVSLALAGASVIPEPSTYIAATGILALGTFVAIRRRQRRRSTTQA